MATRRRLEALYGDTRNAQGKVIATDKNKGVAPAKLRLEKAQILKEMKTEFARLRQEWNGDPEFDGWFSHDVNNAHLNSVAAYYDFVPSFEQLLAANSGKLELFYDAVQRLSKLPKKERHEQLRALAPAANQMGMKVGPIGTND
jgi:predicted aminopeptidase